MLAPGELNDILDALDFRKCILLAGSGLSRNAIRSDGRRLPVWQELMEELLAFADVRKSLSDGNKHEINMLICEKKFPDAAKHLKNIIGDEAFYARLKDIFIDSKPQPTPNHQYIKKLPFRAILTPNFDTLIEDIFSGAQLITLEDFKFHHHLLKNNRFFIFKFHGGIEEKNVILDTADYNEILYNNNSYRDFQKQLFSSHTLLFVGYGMEDGDINKAFDELSTLFPRTHRKEADHFAFLPAGAKGALEKEDALEIKGIKIIEYSPAEDHAELTLILEQLAAAYDLRTRAAAKTTYASESELRQAWLKFSRSYHDQLRGPGGRFQYLNISDTILTGIKDEGQLIDVTVQVNQAAQVPLIAGIRSLWKEATWHAVIIGEGGMGKTVSLIRLWEALLSNSAEEGIIPVFLALNEYNHVPPEGRINYIFNMLAKHYLQKEHLTPDEINYTRQIMRKPLEKGGQFFPAVVLMLDGFNEVTVDRSELFKEIRTILCEDKGVQVILTSRYDLRTVCNWNECNRLDLKELTDEQIHAYIKDKSISQPLHDHISKLVRNPMMLTLYASTSEIANRRKNDPHFVFKEKPETPGEILWNFVESQIVKIFEHYGDQKNKDYLYYRFLLKHILPKIGYAMEQGGRFSLTQEELNKEIARAHQELDFKRDAFFKTFPLFGAIENDLQLNLTEDSRARRRFYRIRDIFCEELMLLIEENETYRFLHQHLRDYFAALHILNEIQVSLTKKEIPVILQAGPLSFDIRRFLGEIEGEHYNKPKLLENKWSTAHYHETKLAQALNACRKEMEGTDIAVLNLIETWKVTKGELSGEDLTHLNLTKVVFNEVRCSRWHGVEYLAAQFDNSWIKGENFFPQGHNSGVKNAIYCPDGKKIISSSMDGEIKEWDVDTGKCIQTFTGHGGSVESVVYSPDGKKIVSASVDGEIKEWDIVSGECIQTFTGHGGSVESVVYSPDGKKIVSASTDGQIKEWDVVSRECIQTFTGHGGSVESAVYSPDGKKIMSASTDGQIKEWDVVSGDCIRTYAGHIDAVKSAVYSSDGIKIVSASKDQWIKEWDVASGKCIRTYEVYHDRINSADYSPDGKRILSSSDDGPIREWDVTSAECIQTYVGHSGLVNSAVYSPDGKRILSSSDDQTIKEWDVASGKCVWTYTKHDEGVNSVAYDPNGKRVLSASADGTIKEWDIAIEKCIQTYIGHNNSIKSAVYSFYKKRILSASLDNTIKEWDMENGECIRTYSAHHGGVNSAVYSPDGKRIVSASDDRTIKEWDVENGACIRTYSGHDGRVKSAFYSPDMKRIVSASLDTTLREWDVTNGGCIRVYMKHSAGVNSAVYSPNGKKIVSASNDKTIREWHVASGECIRTHSGHSGGVNSAVYSPDGKTFVSASKDQTIIEWKVNGEYIRMSNIYGSECNGAVYSPDGKRMVSASYITIKEWDVANGKCIGIFLNIPGLWVHRCTFFQLDPRSKFSSKEKEALEQYSARFE